MPWRQLMGFIISFALVSAQEPIPKLRILIVEGDGAVNNIKRRMARAPIVQVEDENRKPVGGAIVTFTLANRGAGGVFPNGSQSLTVTTDNAGRATANGIQPNNVNGKFEIRVRATRNGLTALATITVINQFAAAPVITAKSITLLSIAAAIVAGVAIGVTRGGNSPSGPPTAVITPPTIITPGTPTVGGPK